MTTLRRRIMDKGLIFCTSLVLFFVSMFLRPDRLLRQQLDNKNRMKTSATMTDEFELYWPLLQEKLCPSKQMIRQPNVTLAFQTLFSLARYEMRTFLLDNNYSESYYEPASDQSKNKNALSSFRNPPTRATSQLVQTFYDGDFDGAMVYHEQLDDRSLSNNQQQQPVIVYPRIWKCGNNQITSGIRQSLHWKNRDQTSYNWTAGTFERMSFAQLEETILAPRRRRAAPRATSDPHWPCVVTAIRDPVTHFLSGYNEVEYRIIVERTFGKDTEHVVTQRYHQIPYNDSDVLREQRFAHMVADLVTEHAAFESENRVYYHFMPMSRLLSYIGLRYNMSLTAYLPTIENLSVEWPVFLENTCNLPTGAILQPMKTRGGRHESSSDPLGVYAAAKRVWAQNGPISRAICALHATDYACWTNLPDGIPKICQEVYASPTFREAILGT